MVAEEKREVRGNARAAEEEFMRRMKLLLVLAFATVNTFLAQVAPATSQVADPDLQFLLGFMTGSFSRTEQARLDPDFFDIRMTV